MAFSSFIQKVFDIESKDLDFEVPIKSEVMEMRGRIDAVFGNLIIEFKKDLTRSLDEAKEELKKYFQAYREKYPETNYLGIANDGIKFEVYQPIIIKNVVKDIDKIDEINLETSSPYDIFLWFDSYFFSTEKIAPTSEDIKKRFGLTSPTFAVIKQELMNLFEQVRDDRPVKVKYENWARYLEIVYGDKVNEINLFITHTYLSTLVKFLVFLKLARKEDKKFAEIPPILFGDSFSQFGILNFMEEDFFTWTMFIAIRKKSSKLFRKLLQDLQVYDLDQIDEDILKELYQGLVHPVVRKQLGEFYTPDWLAEKMIRETLGNNPALKIMDPACGSGTFLFKAIQFKIESLSKKGMKKSDILDHILSSVIGFDIHPLAATIAKTNYLLALRDLLSSRKGSINIPVYLSDSLKIPSKKVDLSTPSAFFEFKAGDSKFLFPVEIASDVTKMDDIIEKMKEHGLEFERIYENLRRSSYANEKSIEETEQNFIASFNRAVSNVKQIDRVLLVKNIKTLFDFIKNDSNSIWTYIIRNMYKPVAISYHKVDVVIGNPPWLALRDMKNSSYQDFLKSQSNNFGLIDTKKIHFMPHVELATLFFCKCVDQYLKENGKIAFVLPKTVLIASQHQNFLKFLRPEIKLEKIWDLEYVKPLFTVLACVLIGKKQSKTQYPVPLTTIYGKLPTKNLNFEKAHPYFTQKKSKFSPISSDLSKSVYFDEFYNGGNLVPRNFFFVQPVSDSSLFINLEIPKIKSDEKNDTKPPWSKILLEGEIEAEFLYGSLLGVDIVPFGIRGLRLVALPIFRSNNESKICSSFQELQKEGYLKAARYFEKTEKHWKENATDKAKKFSIYQWINYRKKIEEQKPRNFFKVVYVSSSTYLASCVVDTTIPLYASFDEFKMKLNGFIAEHKTWCYDTKDPEEAHYLCAIFNSKILDDLIKPLQTRGMFGPRDIERRPLSFPIPRFKKNDPIHKELALLSSQCHSLTPRILKKIKAKSIGRIRSEVRNEIEEQIKKINILVEKILPKADSI